MAATSVATACGAQSVRERRTWKLGHTGCSTIACRYAVYDYLDGRKYVGWWLDAQPHFLGLMSMADGLQYRWVRNIVVASLWVSLLPEGRRRANSD